METLEPGQAADAAHDCARAARLLDQSIDNAALSLELVPVFSRSVMDPRGGRQPRAVARERLFTGILATLDRNPIPGMVPYFVTLTIDRSIWMVDAASEVHAARECLEVMRRKLWRLARRCGCPQWVRVLEWQTASGSGWPHWHLVMWFPREVGPAQVRERIRARWSAIGGGFVKVVRAKRKEGSWQPLAKYAVKYFTKGCDHFPPTLDDPSIKRCPRLYGLSRAVADLLPKRLRSMRRYRQPGESVRLPKSRVLRPLARRLDESGIVYQVRERGIDRSTGEVRYRYLKDRFRLGTLGAQRAHGVGLLKSSTSATRATGVVAEVLDLGALAAFVDAMADDLEAAIVVEVNANAESRRLAWERHQSDTT